jgi:hypothetical protein
MNAQEIEAVDSLTVEEIAYLIQQTKEAKIKEAARQSAIDEALASRPQLNRQELHSEACDLIAAANQKLEFILKEKAERRARKLEARNK